MFKLSPRERNYEIVDQSVFGFNLSRTILAYLFCQSHMSSTRGGTLSERLKRDHQRFHDQPINISEVFSEIDVVCNLLL